MPLPGRRNPNSNGLLRVNSLSAGRCVTWKSRSRSTTEKRTNNPRLEAAGDAFRPLQSLYAYTSGR